MKIKILTAHGYLSFQPDGRLEYRQQAGIWEEFDLQGLEMLRSVLNGPSGPGDDAPPAADPLLGCNPSGSNTDFVSCLCEKIQPRGNLDKAFDVTRRVAWGLRGQGAGLLRKPSGENIVLWHGTWFSASRICFPDGRIYKVLIDVPTTNGPTFQDNGTVDASLYVPAIDPRS